jgi:hypothetical protein
VSNARTFQTIEEAKDAYAEYVPFDGDAGQPQNGQPTQFYKPFPGSPPHDCACVAIWTLTDGRGIAEEY